MKNNKTKNMKKEFANKLKKSLPELTQTTRP